MGVAHHGGRDLDDKREEHPGQHGGRDGLGDRGEQLAQPAGRAQDRRHHAADDVGPDDIRERVQPQLGDQQGGAGNGPGHHDRLAGDPGEDQAHHTGADGDRPHP